MTQTTAAHERSDPERPIRVLIADDVEDVRRLVTLGLRRTGGYDVIAEAGDGAEAVALTREHRPDVLVLDIAMPELDGFEVLAHVAAEMPGTRVVMLSGFGADRFQQRAMDLGAVAYVEKSRGLGGIAGVLDDVCADLRAGTSADRGGEAATADTDDVRRHDELASYILHEISTPIAIIRGYAATLRDTDPSDEALVHTAAETIFRNAEDLSALLRRLQQARAVDAGDMQLDPQRSDLAALVRQTVADLAPVTDPHVVNVNAGAAVETSFDGVRIRQVLTNLVGNAAKYSPEDAPIDIAITIPEDRVEVTVTDHGAGIPPEHREAVFDKFTRMDRSAKGSGLGLYISRGIARAHGGDLAVKDAPGGGCTFVLQLPIS